MVDLSSWFGEGGEMRESLGFPYYGGDARAACRREDACSWVREHGRLSWIGTCRVATLRGTIWRKGSRTSAWRGMRTQVVFARAEGKLTASSTLGIYKSDSEVVRLITRCPPSEFYDVEQRTSLLRPGITRSEMEEIVGTSCDNRKAKELEKRKLAAIFSTSAALADPHALAVAGGFGGNSGGGRFGSTELQPQSQRRFGGAGQQLQRQQQYGGTVQQTQRHQPYGAPGSSRTDSSSMGAPGSSRSDSSSMGAPGCSRSDSSSMGALGSTRSNMGAPNSSRSSSDNMELGDNSSSAGVETSATSSSPDPNISNNMGGLGW